MILTDKFCTLIILPQFLQFFVFQVVDTAHIINNSSGNTSKHLHEGLTRIISVIGKLSRFSNIGEKVEYCKFAIGLCKLSFSGNKNAPQTSVGYAAYELIELGEDDLNLKRSLNFVFL